MYVMIIGSIFLSDGSAGRPIVRTWYFLDYAGEWIGLQNSKPVFGTEKLRWRDYCAGFHIQIDAVVMQIMMTFPTGSLITAIIFLLASV